MRCSVVIPLRLMPLLAALCLPAACPAWDYEGHRLVNQLALASLPAEFPAFVRAPEAAERIAFLGGEPDRWRNTPELPLRHLNGPDHFFDVEDLAPLGLQPRSLSVFRYEFVAQVAAARAAHPERLPVVNPEQDPDRTKALPGFLPWAIAEQHARLRSAFSYLKVYEAHGTAAEAASARANVIHYMGVLGHYVGDAAQPLHTTRHFNGWTGDNPRGYTTSSRFHAWIDGGYLAKTGGVSLETFRSRLAPLAATRPAGTATNVFQTAVEFILDQHRLVEPLYQMEKDGRLKGEGDRALDGRAMLEGQLWKAGRWLGELWLSAWQESHADPFLQSRLEQRKLREGGQPQGGK